MRHNCLIGKIILSTFFENQVSLPLAEQIRPQSLSDVVGQDHLLGSDGILTQMVEAGQMMSCILWGPPGTGKTTIARLLAQGSDLHFEPLSAVFSGVADLKKIFEKSRQRKQMGQKTLLFIDEIHRFNKTQQDSFLPYVEDGTVILVGATTENPSFELNAALLSRCQILTLHHLSESDLNQICSRAEQALKRPLPLDGEAKSALIDMAQGDGRYFVNMMEMIFNLTKDDKQLSTAELENLVQRRKPLYDKSSDGHFNLISAFHKSLRASDVDAAVYYMGRMVDAGEDVKYIFRRMAAFASEDVGMADPTCMVQVMTAWQSFERLGLAEGVLPLTQAVIYCATAPKSNSVYKAYKKAMPVVKATGHMSPPMRMLNAPTQMMKAQGYNEGYMYDHDYEHGFSGQNCFPDALDRQQFYTPNSRGYEKEIGKRLEFWHKLRLVK